MFDQLAELAREFDALEARLPEIYAAGDQAAAREAGRPHAELKPVVEVLRAHTAATADLTDARDLLEGEVDPEMREFLRAEIADREAAVAALEAELRELLVPRDPDDGRNVILEIRGAEGGEEADGPSGMRYRTQRRGGKGLRDIKTTARNGAVVSIVAVRDADQVLMMTARGKIQRVNVAEMRPMGRNTQGVRIMRVDDGDALAAVVPVPPSEHEEADAPVGPDEPTA